jgi:hypothetical protein
MSMRYIVGYDEMDDNDTPRMIGVDLLSFIEKGNDGGLYNHFRQQYLLPSQYIVPVDHMIEKLECFKWEKGKYQLRFHELRDTTIYQDHPSFMLTEIKEDEIVEQVDNFIEDIMKRSL